MNQAVGTVVVVAALVVASLVAPAGALGAPEPASDAQPSLSLAQEGGTNETNTTATPTADGSNTTTGDGNTSFGAAVSSFMQASVVDAENEVDSEMFDARFERSNASERAQLVRQRANGIAERVQELREERERLLSQGNLTVQTRAEAARLAAQANGLSRSVDDVAAKAERTGAGVDATELEELRTNARNLSGPEVAAIAAGMGGPPADRGQGPPAEGERGPTDANETTDGADAPENGNDRGNGNGNENGNDAAGGPDDDAGPNDRGNAADARDEDTPEPEDGDDEAGSGNGNGPN